MYILWLWIVYYWWSRMQEWKCVHLIYLQQNVQLNNYFTLLWTMCCKNPCRSLSYIFFHCYYLLSSRTNHSYLYSVLLTSKIVVFSYPRCFVLFLLSSLFSFCKHFSWKFIVTIFLFFSVCLLVFCPKGFYSWGIHSTRAIIDSWCNGKCSLPSFTSKCKEMCQRRSHVSQDVIDGFV